jgi:hypothetical protein
LNHTLQRQNGNEVQSATQVTSFPPVPLGDSLQKAEKNEPGQESLHYCGRYGRKRVPRKNSATDPGFQFAGSKGPEELVSVDNPET